LILPDDIDDKARKIREVANKLGWTSDISSLINRVKQMDNGLVQEDEFIYILNWSNKCSLIHKLDQFHIPPNAKKKYSIPDLFVVFNHKGKELSFFIEIKTSKYNNLSWSEKYYQGLVNYSKATGVPILIAWKWRSFDIWTLFELNYFQKSVSNYKISFKKAHTENLMSKLAGDFFIVPYDDIGLHFKFKKNKIIETKENDFVWQTVFESIYLTGNEKKEITDINTGILSYLFSLSMEDTVTHTDTHVIYNFTPTNKSAFAQSIPVRLAQAFSNSEVNWLKKIKNQEFSIKYDKLLDTLTKAIDKEVIRNIFHIIPRSEEW